MKQHTLRYIIPALMAMPLLAALPGCVDTDDIEPQDPTICPPDSVIWPDNPSASRTILVYMVATNNLSTNGNFDSSDLEEMQTAATNGDLGDGRLLVYHASYDGIVLKEITAEGTDTLKVYDESLYSISIDRMREVIDDTKAYAPAGDYGLILWSHAAGWLQNGYNDPSARSYGSDNGLTMNITSLAQAVDGAGFSFIYFDCCYMGSVETMYELRNATPYFVGSPAEIPANGMPYHKNLRYLMDTDVPVRDAMVNAATSTFNYYNDYFEKGDCPNTMVVVESSRLDALAQATREIYSAADKLYDSGTDYQRFKTGVCYYYDLDQYVESICTDTAELALWREALDEAVVYKAASPWVWSTFPIERYCGLSTYILKSPESANDSNYRTLSWYGDVASALIK